MRCRRTTAEPASARRARRRTSIGFALDCESSPGGRFMQRILVTGANRGLGLEFTRQLLVAGARVYAACRHPGKALGLTELAAGYPGHLHVLPLELDKDRSIAELVRELGALTPALDGLINNAGMLVSGERYGELSAKAITESFTSN